MDYWDGCGWLNFVTKAMEGQKKHAEARQRNESHTSPVSSTAKKKRIFCAIFTRSDWWLHERKLLQFCSLAAHLSCLYEVEKVNKLRHGAHLACVIMSLPIIPLELPALTFRIFFRRIKTPWLKNTEGKGCWWCCPWFSSSLFFYCGLWKQSNTTCGHWKKHKAILVY